VTKIWRPPFLPTRRLAWVVMASGVVWLVPLLGHAVQWVPWAVLAAIGVAALVDAALTPGRRSIAVERSVPGVLGVGDRVTGRYTVQARWPLTLAAQLYHALPTAVSSPDAEPLRFRIGGTASEVPFTLTGRERGDVALGRVVLRVAGPLGLVTRTVRMPLPGRIAVIPSVARLPQYQLLALQYRLREVGTRALRRRGEGSNFTGLRDYVPGDDPRHIDWKATARRRRPITREFTVEQGQTVMIMLDAGRLMTTLAGPMPRFEYALSSALILANVVVQSGDAVGLMIFDDEVRTYVPPGRGSSAIRAMRDALVPATATLTEPDYAAAFRTLATRHRKRSLLVIFSDVIDERASRSLIAHTMRGARTHLPLVIALRNEALVEAASPAARTTSDGIYESVAAEELLTARDEALERMRRAGVSVVDVRPQAMTAAVVNRYLELKGRGAI